MSTQNSFGTLATLLVDGVARELGLAPFGLFEIAPLGLCVALVGGGFLALFGALLAKFNSGFISTGAVEQNGVCPNLYRDVQRHAGVTLSRCHAGAYHMCLPHPSRF